MAGSISSQPKKWLNKKIFVQSKWLTVYKGTALSNGGDELEYWSLARGDSVIVIILQDEKFILPEPQFRPGIDKVTLDFLGGRVNDDSPTEAAASTVRRELQLSDSIEIPLKPLTSQPLFVDSAMSDQRLFGFVAELPNDVKIDARSYTADELREQLQCLQCRAVLLEWLCRSRSK